MKTKKREHFFTNSSPMMLPSIQNAVDHFRTAMTRQKSNIVRLPPLTKSPDYYGGRIKYKHRSSEEAMRNSENWDKLKFILSEESTTNSIDMVYEVNKPGSKIMDTLECSPPLISTSVSKDIFENKVKELNLKRNVTGKTTLTSFADELKITEDHVTKTSRNIHDEKNESVPIYAEDKNFKAENKFQKYNLIESEEQKPLQKKVRFDLNDNTQRTKFAESFKSQRTKNKKCFLTKTKVSDLTIQQSPSSRSIHQSKKVGLAMKQIIRGQTIGKHGRSQRC
ncbi:uncharacterized protein LOC134723397 [Mytilus trossulus]|uniref:uncharacterized protein LOC134723397 n=1 Tax=Mytilus trossulus TaxID=6551 RepID=UPI003004C30F